MCVFQVLILDERVFKTNISLSCNLPCHNLFHIFHVYSAYKVMHDFIFDKVCPLSNQRQEMWCGS